MSIFFTADTHFCHKNIIKHEDRPFNSIEEMNEIMIKKWNAKVRPTDTIYILGDFIFSDGVTATQLVKRLNGKKYLIIQFEPGFITEDETEVLGFTLNYLTNRSSPKKNDISNK